MRSFCILYTVTVHLQCTKHTFIGLYTVHAAAPTVTVNFIQNAKGNFQRLVSRQRISVLKHVVNKTIAIKDVRSRNIVIDGIKEPDDEQLKSPQSSRRDQQETCISNGNAIT